MNASMFGFVLVAIVLLIFQIRNLSNLAYNTKVVDALTSEIRELDREKSNLTFRLAMRNNIKRVHDEATTRLGMVPAPDESIRVILIDPSIETIPIN